MDQEEPLSVRVEPWVAGMWGGAVRRCLGNAADSSTYDVGGDCGVGLGSVFYLVGLCC